MYYIGSYEVGTAAPGAANSAESVLAVARSEPNCSKYLVGYDLGDEPPCTTSIAAQAAAVRAVDPTRMDYENVAGQFVNADCRANLNAPSIASADGYFITNPWVAFPNTGCLKVHDCLYLYGRYTRSMIAADTSGHPVWVFVESGTNFFFSQQNGSVCNPRTNLCSNGNEYKATPIQVNSAAWLTLINGSNGVEWFCTDERAPDYCAGGGPDGRTRGGSTRSSRGI